MSFQKKKFLGPGSSRGIFVTCYVLCNLMYLVYFLYPLHYISYAHTILLYTYLIYTSCSASHKDEM